MIVDKKLIPEILETKLPDIIKQVAKENNIPQYISDCDFFDARLKKWHQFGILSHSKKVRESFIQEVPNLLRKWEIYQDVSDYFSKKIEDLEKKLLFESSIPLHDLGKIIVYGSSKENRDHENYSKYLLHSYNIEKELTNLGLSENQIGYIGRCIETHGILGKKARDIIKEKNSLNLEFISSQDVANLCRNLSKEYEDVKIEIGIFYLCDSLGKTDIRINAENDLDILDQDKKILNILEERNLPLDLINAAMQLPINVRLVEVYLKQLF
jgi:hypothetical protein